VETLRRYFQEKSTVQLAILFGSHARGSQDRRSDIDLLVVHRTSRDFFRRYQDFPELWDMFPCAIDLLSYTPEEWEKVKDRRFFQQILKEGILLVGPT